MEVNLQPSTCNLQPVTGFFIYYIFIMKRLLRYLVAVLIVLICVYGFWLWLQYKWATVIKQTTASIMTELTSVEKLETAKEDFIETIEGEQQLAALTPNIWVDQIINSALFKDKMVLEVEWEVSAGYMIGDIVSNSITVSRDGTVTIVLWEPQIFWVDLTGVLLTTKLGITTQKDIDMENTLRQKAGEIMIQKALSGGILEEAKNNAQSKLQDLFLKANIQIKEVVIKWMGDIE